MVSYFPDISFFKIFPLYFCIFHFFSFLKLFIRNYINKLKQKSWKKKIIPLKKTNRRGNKYREHLSIFDGVTFRQAREAFLGFANGAGHITGSGIKRGCCIKGIVRQSQSGGISIFVPLKHMVKKPFCISFRRKCFLENSIIRKSSLKDYLIRCTVQDEI